jgi:hypothetical protein
MAQTQQQFVQEILDHVRPSLNNPSNPFYLPKYVVENKLDPYQPPQGSTWEIDNLNSKNILNELPAVCADIQMSYTPGQGPCKNENDSYNAVPNRGADITISNITVTGASNAFLSTATAISPDGFTLQFVIDFSTLQNFPAPVTIAGNFELTLYCCCGPNLTGCRDPNTKGDPHSGSGTFTAIIKSSSATCTVQITDLAEGVLNLAVQQISFQASTKGGNMAVTPKITSIPGKEGQSYTNLAQEAFNDEGTLEYVLEQINVQLNKPGGLSQMGSVLQTELDNYLKSNHEYPFDQSSAVAF